MFKNDSQSSGTEKDIIKEFVDQSLERDIIKEYVDQSFDREQQREKDRGKDRQREVGEKARKEKEERKKEKQKILSKEKVSITKKELAECLQKIDLQVTKEFTLIFQIIRLKHWIFVSKFSFKVMSYDRPGTL